MDPIELASQLFSCLNLVVLLPLKPWSHQQHLLNQKCCFSKTYGGHPRKMRNAEITLKEFAHCVSTWIQNAFIYVCVCVCVYAYVHRYIDIHMYICIFNHSTFLYSVQFVSKPSS